jgi:phage shock protein PspC (stress-responsive transcriptional regulator)
MNENEHDETSGTGADQGRPTHGEPAHEGAGASPRYGTGAGTQYGTDAGSQYGTGAGPQYGAGTGPQYGTGTGAGPQGAPPGGPEWGQQRTQSTGDRLLQDLRALRRSRDDRVVAGVCGGVARQLGIDPLLVRVVTAVLFCFGAGVVLYALGWLLLPTDDGSPSVGEQAVARGGARSSTSTVLLAVALAVVASLGLGAAFSHWDGPFLFFLAAGGLLAWLILRDRRGEAPVATASATASTAAPPTVYAGAATGGTAYAAAAPPAGGVSVGKAPQGSGQPTGPAAANPLPTYQPRPPYQPSGYQAPGYQASGYQSGYQAGHQAPGYPPPAGPPHGPQGAAPQPVPPPPPAPRRPRSALFSVTMSLVLVGLGTLKLVELSGTSVVAAAYPALALTIIALALVVGTWVGRSRGLIAMGIIAALLTGAVSAADGWNHHRGNHVNLRLAPSSVAELPSSQQYSTGSVRYDLTRLDFTGTSHTMKVSMGVGEIVVIVPRDVDVTATASMGIGQVDLFDQGRGGFPSDVTVTNLGDDGVGGGTLDLDLDAGIGHLEVRRG